MHPSTQASSLHSRLGSLAMHSVGHGRALVLLHGGAGSWTHWTSNLDALAREHTVHAIDLPGCGESPDVPSHIAPDDYMRHVAEAIVALGGGRILLAGFSFGAVIAARTAALFPDAVERVVLAGPGGFGKPVGRELDLRRVPGEGDKAGAWPALRHNLLQMMLADPRSIDDATLELHYRNVLRARFDSRKVSLGETLLDDLARIRCPAAVIWGALDQLAHPSVAGRAAACRERKSDIEIHSIPGGGHWVQYEQPAAFNEAIIRFLAASEPAQPSIRVASQAPRSP